MAESDRQTSDSIAAELALRPYAFNFFQAVRRLESEHPSNPRVGSSIRLEEEYLRFCQIPSLAFAPSSIEQVQQVNAVVRMYVNFLGLFGPNGPLPQHLTEFARDRQRNAHDPTLVRFMDIFHHRMLSFFYRAWATNEKSVDFDRADDARYADYFGSLFGIGTASVQNRDSVLDCTKIHFSGRMSAQTRNAEGLEAILGNYFGIPTRIREFEGYWMKIPKENQCRLGETPETGSLGINAIAGERKYEVQLKFRILMGPMDFADLQRLVPIGPSFRRLKDWVLNYVNQEFYWDLQCIVKAVEVPGIALGQGAMLGWTTWLKSKEFTRDPDDPIFDPDSYE
ncbi:MAG TPA: type VI secretion system baseplate subunit TssG [Chthoniobacterales bacterium]|nr:type VI secretion system baseplate subunit TssG [Chthoniobacterales bacterium]